MIRCAVIERMKQRNEYTSADLEPEHKKVVLDMILRSFAEKGDLTTLASVSYDILHNQLDVLSLASSLAGKTEHCLWQNKSVCMGKRPFS